ncbi:MAG: hypothetical protein Fur0037_20840 [Planctomycetota bacterium]
MKTPLILVSVSLASCAGFPAGQAPATPQRPTLSSSPDTTAEGTLEVETGLAVDPSDFVKWPTALKWGAGDHTELYAATSPWTHLRRGDVDGPEDLSLGLRHRILDETADHPAVAVQIANQLPTGNRGKGLGSGGTQFFGAVAAAKGFGSENLAAFYQLGLLDDPGGGRPDYEHDFAFTLTHRIDDRWSAYGELDAVLVRDRDVESLFTALGAQFAVNPSVVLDAGIVVGMSRDAPDFQIVFGGTWNLGRPGRM